MKRTEIRTLIRKDWIVVIRKVQQIFHLAVSFNIDVAIYMGKLQHVAHKLTMDNKFCLIKVNLLAKQILQNHLIRVFEKNMF